MRHNKVMALRNRARLGFVKNVTNLHLSVERHPFVVNYLVQGFDPWAEARFSNLGAAVDTAITRGGTVVVSGSPALSTSECEKEWLERPRGFKERQRQDLLLDEMRKLREEHA